jgi:hypothetical protein
MAGLYGRAGCLTAENGGWAVMGTHFFSPANVMKLLGARHRRPPPPLRFLFWIFPYPPVGLIRDSPYKTNRRGAADTAWARRERQGLEDLGGGDRARPHCRFAPPLIHFTPDPLTESVPLWRDF